eukprot:gene17908-14457_t
MLPRQPQDGVSLRSRTGEGEFVVEKILDDRLGDEGNHEWLVLWRSDPPEETWEPRESFANNALFQEYEQARQNRANYEKEDNGPAQEIEGAGMSVGEDDGGSSLGGGRGGRGGSGYGGGRRRTRTEEDSAVDLSPKEDNLKKRRRHQRGRGKEKAHAAPDDESDESDFEKLVKRNKLRADSILSSSEDEGAAGGEKKGDSSNVPSIDEIVNADVSGTAMAANSKRLPNFARSSGPPRPRPRESEKKGKKGKEKGKGKGAASSGTQRGRTNSNSSRSRSSRSRRSKSDGGGGGGGGGGGKAGAGVREDGDGDEDEDGGRATSPSTDFTAEEIQQEKKYIKATLKPIIKNGKYVECPGESDESDLEHKYSCPQKDKHSGKCGPETEYVYVHGNVANKRASLMRFYLILIFGFKFRKFEDGEFAYYAQGTYINRPGYIKGGNKAFQKKKVCKRFRDYGLWLRLNDNEKWQLYHTREVQHGAGSGHGHQVTKARLMSGNPGLPASENTYDVGGTWMMHTPMSKGASLFCQQEVLAIHVQTSNNAKAAARSVADGSAGAANGVAEQITIGSNDDNEEEDEDEDEDDDGGGGSSDGQRWRGKRRLRDGRARSDRGNRERSRDMGRVRDGAYRGGKSKGKGNAKGRGKAAHNSRRYLDEEYDSDDARAAASAKMARSKATADSIRAGGHAGAAPFNQEPAMKKLTTKQQGFDFARHQKLRDKLLEKKTHQVTLTPAEREMLAAKQDTQRARPPSLPRPMQQRGGPIAPQHFPRRTMEIKKEDTYDDFVQHLLKPPDPAQARMDRASRAKQRQQRAQEVAYAQTAAHKRKVAQKRKQATKAQPRRQGYSDGNSSEEDDDSDQQGMNDNGDDDYVPREAKKAKKMGAKRRAQPKGRARRPAAATAKMEDLSEYEIAREYRMAQNKKMMESLGLGGGSKKMMGTSSSSSSSAPSSSGESAGTSSTSEDDDGCSSTGAQPAATVCCALTQAQEIAYTK